MEHTPHPPHPPHFLESRIPPPLVTALLAGLVWLAAREWPQWGLGEPAGWQRVASVLLMLAGFGMDLAGLVWFRRARTTINPLKPEAASALVTTGLHGRTRNPMYVGMVLLLCGWGLGLGHAAGLIAPPLLVAYLTRFQIIPEERVLRERFGAEFERYAARVPRWW